MDKQDIEAREVFESYLKKNFGTTDCDKYHDYPCDQFFIDGWLAAKQDLDNKGVDGE